MQKYVNINIIYLVSGANFKFAAKAIWENDTHIGFENSYYKQTILAKSAIRELVDLGKPKGGV
ncbi:MAG: hypothetical protein WAW33_03080 [Minisyncoccia bacterium]